MWASRVVAHVHHGCSTQVGGDQHNQAVWELKHYSIVNCMSHELLLDCMALHSVMMAMPQPLRQCEKQQHTFAGAADDE